MSGSSAAPASPSASQAVPAHFQSFLALDLGLKRSGVAVGNRMLRTATPQATIRAEGDARFAHVAERIREWQPDALVIGVPYHPDGASHENTARALKFARQLRGRFGLPVFEVDERYSTTEAHAAGARDADAASACIILEQFLRNLP
ncbi:Holliday junction resolvase RuvX [Paracidovorax wautersii]|uniref:Putative pre-16S rRNA nuclease n=1 Tax=Paracidovorax wautersii TaxID=1177982 RepID=A0A1I2FTT1_9BURK|nr:Holliday junction resolvase RuvX [Paracidovorax wautersii]SFF08735.1 putative holliday junction resolvase [Paracidovorax wautersii]